MLSGVAPAVSATPLPTTGGAPVWKRGYEWSYRQESPTGKSTYVWVVDREEVRDGIECYVIKSGTREIFYRKSDLAFVRETVEGALTRHVKPPTAGYVWPLVVGKTWEQSYHEERPQARQTEEIERTASVEAEEPVTVAAGTFQTFKITLRNKRTSAVVYEMWYAPDVGQWVKIRERLASGLREREMTAYALAATESLTPAKQRVTRAFEICNAEVGRTMRLVSLEPNGQFRYAPTHSMMADDPALPQFRQCLRDRFGFRFAGDPGFGQGKQ